MNLLPPPHPPAQGPPKCGKGVLTRSMHAFMPDCLKFILSPDTEFPFAGLADTHRIAVADDWRWSSQPVTSTLLAMEQVAFKINAKNKDERTYGSKVFFLLSSNNLDGCKPESAWALEGNKEAGNSRLKRCPCKALTDPRDTVAGLSCRSCSSKFWREKLSAPH
jgi:hypothetical protein